MGTVALPTRVGRRRAWRPQHHPTRCRPEAPGRLAAEQQSQAEPVGRRKNPPGYDSCGSPPGPWRRRSSLPPGRPGCAPPRRRVRAVPASAAPTASSSMRAAFRLSAERSTPAMVVAAAFAVRQSRRRRPPVRSHRRRPGPPCGRRIVGLRPLGHRAGRPGHHCGHRYHCLAVFGPGGRTSIGAGRRAGAGPGGRRERADAPLPSGVRIAPVPCGPRRPAATASATRGPKTMPSSSKVGDSQVVTVEAVSPAAHRPGNEVAPSRSVSMPPH